MNNKNRMAELVLFNGDFRTQDLKRPWASAVAIRDGRIVAVGEDREVLSLTGPNTQVINLDGRLGLPGMIDSHFHYYYWVLGKKQLPLSDVYSFQELIDRIYQAARKTPQGRWILGQGWNESNWPENGMPTRYDLDAVAPFHPVVLWRCDRHLAVVNSMALKQAKICSDTPDPPKGVIVRDVSGHPNGILCEHAVNLVKEAIPIPTEEEIVQAMEDGIPGLHSLGLTGIHDIYLMGGNEWKRTYNAWQRIRDAKKLDLRCWVSIPGEHLNEAIAQGFRTGFGDDRLNIGHVKYYADGSMGARTAWMIDPYLDADYGMSLFNMEELKKEIHRADQAGLAVMVHAIGDRANRELVAIFEKMEKRHVGEKKTCFASRTIPHRVEHVQVIRPEDLARLAYLELTACVQPANIPLDISMIDESVGVKGKWAYAFRDMLDAGISLIFSSDCPVCDPNPFVGIHAAVTRRRHDGTPPKGWYPIQRITVEEAVRGYTIAPAMASGRDDELGSITPGKQSDIIVLDRNIYTVDPMEIIDTNVEITIFDGRIVFRR